LNLKKKIVLLGDSAVGKTSLIRRYVFDQFEDSYISTIGTKVSKKVLKVHQLKDTVNLKLMIWDLIGREGYYGIHSRTFVGVHGVIFVADLTRRETLLSLERYWIPVLFKVVSNIPMVFVCNKSDLEDQYEFEPSELEEIANKYCIMDGKSYPYGLKPYYTTSAKMGSNVENAFEALGRLVVAGTELGDPMKQLYESVVATGIARSLNKSTAIGALDAIILDFCSGFADQSLAMLLVRQELARAGINISEPKKKNILKAVEYLAEAENEYLDDEVVKENLRKRLEWAKGIGN
jgi:small GTP-binding protein